MRNALSPAESMTSKVRGALNSGKMTHLDEERIYVGYIKMLPCGVRSLIAEGVLSSTYMVHS